MKNFTNFTLLIFIAICVNTYMPMQIGRKKSIFYCCEK